MSVQEIMLEHGQLLATCAAQRDELTRAVQTWQGPLRIADGALVTANYLREHPAALAAVVTLSAAAGPRGIWRSARRAMVVWRTLRIFRGFTLRQATDNSGDTASTGPFARWLRE